MDELTAGELSMLHWLASPGEHLVDSDVGCAVLNGLAERGLATATNLPGGRYTRGSLTAVGRELAGAEPAAWQWKKAQAWHTAERPSIENPERYARAMAGRSGQVRPIYAAPPPEPAALAKLRALAAAMVERLEANPAWRPSRPEAYALCNAVGEACPDIDACEDDN